jgi:hypothetical protein
LKGGLKFLEAYFSRLITPQLADEIVLQKEVAMALTPPNPPPIRRTEAAHFQPTNNPPRSRKAEQEISLADLEWD